MERRTELTRDEQNMFLTAEDITVSRLASVFKVSIFVGYLHIHTCSLCANMPIEFIHPQVKPHTLYLEEMYTKNAEFPDKGRFKLKDDVLYTHYIVCGDSETCESASSMTELS